MWFYFPRPRTPRICDPVTFLPTSLILNPQLYLHLLRGGTSTNTNNNHGQDKEKLASRGESYTSHNNSCCQCHCNHQRKNNQYYVHHCNQRCRTKTLLSFSISTMITKIIITTTSHHPEKNNTNNNTIRNKNTKYYGAPPRRVHYFIGWSVVNCWMKADGADFLYRHRSSPPLVLFCI